MPLRVTCIGLQYNRILKCEGTFTSSLQNCFRASFKRLPTGDSSFVRDVQTGERRGEGADAAKEACSFHSSQRCRHQSNVGLFPSLRLVLRSSAGILSSRLFLVSSTIQLPLHSWAYPSRSATRFTARCLETASFTSNFSPILTRSQCAKKYWIRFPGRATPSGLRWSIHQMDQQMRMRKSY